jgi:hypothetical protein
MINPTSLRNDVSQIINEGNQVRISYYTLTDTGSGYDDSYKLTKSGSDIWTSGLIQPVKSPQGSFEARLVEEGKLTTNDSRLYLLGDIQTSGQGIKIGIGSPVSRLFEVLPEGVEAWELQNEIIYKKVMIRRLPTGSLINEY